MRVCGSEEPGPRGGRERRAERRAQVQVQGDALGVGGQRQQSVGSAGFANRCKSKYQNCAYLVHAGRLLSSLSVGKSMDGWMDGNIDR